MEKLIIANWKMNPSTFAEAEALFQATLEAAQSFESVETVICPPFTWLTDLSHKHADKIKFGAQDLFWEDRGAFTGEISPAMLLSSGVTHVIIGHSERRRLLGETDEMVNKKVLAALRNGLVPIVCVGETTREGRSWDEIKEYIAKQVTIALDGVDASSSIIIAYEPIWAIGTGVPDKPEDTLKVVEFIRAILNTKYLIQNTRIIYGGSVNAKNAESFLLHQKIEGALVGGASLKMDEFGEILRIADRS